MKENFEEVKQTIKSLVDLKFLPVIKNKIKLEREFIDKCSNDFTRILKFGESQNSIDKEKFISKVIVEYKQLEDLINKYFQRDKFDDLTEIYPDYYSALKKYISDSESIVSEFQDAERFQKNAGDKLHIKIRKPLKKFFLGVNNLPITIGNLFRKLFKKPLKEKKKWKRKILLRNLRDEYFNFKLSSELIELNKNTLAIRSGIIKELWQIFETLDRKILDNIYPQDGGEKEEQKSDVDIPALINELHLKLRNFEESLASEANNKIDLVMQEYQKAYQIAGTIEFPKRHLKKNAVDKSNKNLKSKFKKLHSGWENNFAALADDWQMNVEFYLIRYNSEVELIKHKKQFKESVTDNFIPHTNKLLETVNKFIESLSTASNSKQLLDISKQIKNEINQVVTPQLIYSANAALSEQNLVAITAEYEVVVNEYITHVKKERLLVKTDTYDSEIKDSEINTFFPKEVLEYSAAPKFFLRTSKIKTSVNSQIQQIQNDISEIDHISDFTISSTLNLLESEDKFDEAKNIAIEGLQRVLRRLEEIRDKFNKLVAFYASELDSATFEFNKDLTSLTHTEKIFDIRIQLAKARAVQKSKQVRRLAIERVKKLLPHIYWLIRKQFRKLSGLYHKILGIVGLTPPTKAISIEVSNYLAETQTAIQKLPFVYQRLFEIKPLEDLRFFLGRESELKALNNAFNSWKKSKFAPTIIVGEKGSGASSLINSFVTDHLNEYDTVRILLNHPFSDSAALLNLFAETFKKDKFNSVKDLIDYLNNDSEKKIIIIENLQRLFLRKIDGFQAMKTFFEIISRTNTSIFWISTCTLYGWIYLDKTIHAPDYFGYVVTLNKMNESQITKLVSKRHRVSGYNIEYEGDDNIINSKTYKKLSEEEKQPYLMKKYFEELNKFAQSNISLALIFWLRSAREIVDDVIKIGNPPELDYSFLESLSAEKIFALTTLVLHDGITEEDHSKIFNVPLNKSKLLFMLMRDDGIIIKQNNLFIVNPLLYRQVVGLLKSRNILH